MINANAAVLLLLSFAVYGGMSSCVYYNDETHNFYDLTPLSAAGPFTYTDNSTGFVFEVSFCASDTSCEGQSVCQFDGSTEYGCGATSAQAFSPYLEDITKNGVSVSYFNGQQCSNGVTRKTSINVACDATVQDFTFDMVTEVSPCNYVASGRSVYA
eukprot:CAMPEP_0114627436 /NCGR_PEP_ID=MMETSP0168-20121206/12296_1 /TAXON_ID=95228 ORGANISM="Vannella sp., Strain DIVA3 517/6/12" /NCGR_SAMPLE_ID=MMETSP0168 /ASSEMBLY_ACC=CAM_ASM_000044 /LENGTH=156 /DNA_ID=CAMNT_0001838771 /DNA_START=32 /DNA_END=499 /DNA_ORIENTATION=-